MIIGREVRVWARVGPGGCWGPVTAAMVIGLEAEGLDRVAPDSERETAAAVMITGPVGTVLFGSQGAAMTIGH